MFPKSPTFLPFLLVSSTSRFRSGQGLRPLFARLPGVGQILTDHNHLSTASTPDIKNKIVALDIHKGCGPDGILSIVLQQCSDLLSNILARTRIFKSMPT